MTDLVFIIGVFGYFVLGILAICAALALLAAAWSKATESVIVTARNEERLRIIQYLHTTSWWFSEYQDAQHALALAAEEMATGRQDSSRLRETFKLKTGRKP